MSTLTLTTSQIAQGAQAVRIAEEALVRHPGFTAELEDLFNEVMEAKQRLEAALTAGLKKDHMTVVAGFERALTSQTGKTQAAETSLIQVRGALEQLKVTNTAAQRSSEGRIASLEQTLQKTDATFQASEQKVRELQTELERTKRESAEQKRVFELTIQRLLGENQGLSANLKVSVERNTTLLAHLKTAEGFLERYQPRNPSPKEGSSRGWSPSPMRRRWSPYRRPANAPQYAPLTVEDLRRLTTYVYQT